MTAIRLVLCDDQEMVREGLRTILSGVNGIEVVAVAANGAEAVEAVSRHSPDVVLMDLKMPIMDGVAATREIVTRFPQVRVLVLTTYDADEWVLDAVTAGASGYLLKDTPRDRLVEAVRDTASGRTHLHPDVAGAVMARATAGTVPVGRSPVIADLSPRELDVLRLLGRGMANADIAAALFLSEGTVRNYVSSMLGKLHLEDRTQAAVLAVRHGLTDTPS